jgi:hypothetical protein
LKEAAGFLRSKNGSGRANDTGGGNRACPVSQPVDSRALAYGDGGRGEKWGEGATRILPVRSNVQGGLAQPRSQAAVGRTLKEGRSHTGGLEHPPDLWGWGKIPGWLTRAQRKLCVATKLSRVSGQRSPRSSFRFGLSFEFSTDLSSWCYVSKFASRPPLPCKVCWRHGADGITALERALVWGLLCLFR